MEPADLASTAPPRRASRWRAAALWCAAVLAWSLLLFSYRYLDIVLSGDRETWVAPLINELSGGLAAGLLFFPVRGLVRRLPLRPGALLGRLPAYVAGTLAFAAAHTTLMWAQRELLYPLAGLGNYDYGKMPLRYLMELPMQAIGFAAMVGALHAVDGVRRARQRELRAAQLERSLAQAQLRGLRLQLQPHFLFNALNTISAVMYTDPRAADEMLEQLAELLRASLRTGQVDQLPLREELALLDRYLAILRGRFGDRLRVVTRFEPEAADALVPSLLLQPLVENAVRHGNVSRSGQGEVEVRARREGDRLVLEVEDDGPGAAEATAAAGGLGLAATAERLELLYGAQQSFTAGNGPRGGFLVRMALPWRRAEGSPA
jgi:signal transduction histidine kinase